VLRGAGKSKGASALFLVDTLGLGLLWSGRRMSRTAKERTSGGRDWRHRSGAGVCSGPMAPMRGRSRTG
jgi:hypothetical protein